MRKEVVFAVTLGLVLGSTLVYGIYTANKATSTITTTDTGTTPENQSPNDQPSTQVLTLSSPKDGEIFYSPPATISGQTDPANVVVIITETDHLIPKLTENGNFSQSINLIRGGNLVQITSITTNGQRQDAYLNLVYTSPPEPNISDQE